MSRQQVGISCILLISLFLLQTCTKDQLSNPLDLSLLEVLDNRSPDGSHAAYILPQHDDYSNIPQDPKNPITKEKVELGKLLFFETGLALAPAQEIAKESFSCGSCHIPASGFLPGRPQGIADGGSGFGEQGENREKLSTYLPTEIDAQGIRPLPTINVAFVTNTSWSGQFGATDLNVGTESLWNNTPDTELNHKGFFGIETQNMAGLELHRMVVNKTVFDTLGYTPMFDAAFASYPVDERYTVETTALALSAYARTLLPNQAPFQEWLKGQQYAMTDQQKRGALLFFGKAGCNNCHQSPALSAMKFEGVGVEDLFENGGLGTDLADVKNKGRGGFTLKEEDLFKFRVPQLYNLKDAGFYFHGSSHNDLRDVVQYFNLGVPENDRVPATQISPLFRPLHLSDAEVDDLTSFIKDALFDPDLQRYAPDAVLSGNCIPNNDAFSRIDLNCN